MSRQRLPVAVGEQLVAAASPRSQRLDQPRDVRIGDRLHAALATLRLVVEDDRVAADRRRGAFASSPGRRSRSPRRSPPSRSGRSRGRAAGRRRRARARARCRPLRRSLLHPLPQLGKRAREIDHRVELLPVAALAPAVVVAVLLASPRVHPGRLDVPQRVRADPDLLPGRRDGECPDPLDDVVVLDPLARRVVEVLEAPPPPPASDSGENNRPASRLMPPRLPRRGAVRRAAPRCWSRRARHS